MTQMKHLSIVDGAFLHMESAEMPMHVGSLNLFEPPAGYTGEGFYEAVKAHVAKRMHLAAVFTRKLALMPFDLANPVWIHDDDIDLDYHVRYMVLPKPGTIEQLEALAARLHSMLLDRSRPLWEFYIIEGLADGRIGFYGKVHHAAVDGQAGVAMATSLFDLTPEPRAVKPPREARANTYQLGVAELLAAALTTRSGRSCRASSCCRRSAQHGVRRGAEGDRGAARARPTDDRAARKAEKRADALQARAGDAVQPLDHQPARLRRRLAAAARDQGDRQGARRVDQRRRAVAVQHGAARVPEGRPRAAREVARRRRADLAAPGRRHDRQQPGRRHADRPRHRDADPAERLKAIKRGTAAMKKQMGTFRGVIPTDFPSLGSPWLISGLASLYGRSRIADWLRITNVTISNVPGSRVPVYLCGAKMTDYYPLSIVVHGIALNITVQSHVDQLCFGLIACRRAVPDVHELGAHLQRAMARLRTLVAAPALSARRPRCRAAPRAATPSRQAARAAPRRTPRAAPAAPARVAPGARAAPARHRPRAAAVKAAKPRKTPQRRGRARAAP